MSESVSSKAKVGHPIKGVEVVDMGESLFSLTQINNLYLNFAEPLIRHLTWLQNLALEKGISIRLSANSLDFARETKLVRMSVGHLVYAEDMINSFDYYHSAVAPTHCNGFDIVDYSSPRYHDVVGFDLMPVHFPSFCEPVVTTTQYIDFAGLSEGDIVLDLGAYSGMTSIIFKELVGDTGRVVAVDADRTNLDSVRRNLRLYERVSGKKVDLFEGAVWEHDRGISFSTEGNMGASALEIVGAGRGESTSVASITLAGLVSRFGLPKVDFIKCDVEGAEAVIFSDPAFFERFRPRIIIETHLVGGVMTTAKCIDQLGRHGYSSEEVIQHGVVLPLLQCSPSA